MKTVNWRHLNLTNKRCLTKIGCTIPLRSIIILWSPAIWQFARTPKKWTRLTANLSSGFVLTMMMESIPVSMVRTDLKMLAKLPLKMVSVMKSWYQPKLAGQLKGCQSRNWMLMVISQIGNTMWPKLATAKITLQKWQLAMLNWSRVIRRRSSHLIVIILLQ